MTMTEALTSVTGRTITRPITSVAGSRIDDVYGEDGEDGDEDADEVTTTTNHPFYFLLFAISAAIFAATCRNYVRYNWLAH